MSVILILP